MRSILLSDDKLLNSRMSLMHRKTRGAPKTLIAVEVASEFILFSLRRPIIAGYESLLSYMLTYIMDFSELQNTTLMWTLNV